MRVLHVLEAVGGGTLRHVADLVSAIPVDHHVACPSERTTQLSHPDAVGFLESAGATVHPLGMSRRPTDLSNLRAVVQLRALVEELKPDVVHGHSSVGGAVARLAVGRRVPVIWTPNGINEVSWVSAVERRLRSRMARMVSVSPSEAKVAVRRGIVDADQVRIIYNGLPAFDPVTTGVREEIGIPDDAPVLGFVGRFCEQKDPLTFIRTARRVLADIPNAHVLCVGSGPMEAEVLDLAARTLPSNRFHHVVRDAGANELLQAMDVLVSPSRYEGGPYLLLEAALAGVAVVTSDCTGSRDYVVDGVSGLHAPIGDDALMAAQAVGLLRFPETRERLVQSAAEHVHSRHSLAAMARGHQELYLEVAPLASAVELMDGTLDEVSYATG